MRIIVWAVLSNFAVPNYEGVQSSVGQRKKKHRKRIESTGLEHGSLKRKELKQLD